LTVKKGLSIFLSLSVIVSGTLLYLSIDSSSWEIFKRADILRLALAGVLVIVVWFLDALKMKFLTRAAGEEISLGFALELTLINYFGAAVTPMQSGGGPFQMYMMYKRGIGVGKSVAITIARTFLTMLFLGCAIPFSLIFHMDLPNTGREFRVFIFYVVLFSIVSLFVIIISFIKPRMIKKLFYIVVIVLKRLGAITPKLAAWALRRIGREIDAYNQNIRDFMTKGRSYFLLGIAAGITQMLVYLSIMPCLIWAIRMPVKYIECILIQALFLFLLYFIPTPGGSGAAEGGAAMIFSIFVPWSVAGTLGIGWRFLTEYTGIIFGLLIAMKEIGWNVTNSMAMKQDGDEET
jgi:uncharacterized protein (TIRG00374 family)